MLIKIREKITLETVIDGFVRRREVHLAEDIRGETMLTIATIDT